MKPVFIITMVATVIIGITVPSVFAETVSNDFGSATLDENSIIRKQSGGSHIFCEQILVTGTITDSGYGKGQIIVITPGGSSYWKNYFIASQDGSFKHLLSFVGCKEFGVYNVFVSYAGNDIGTLHFSLSDVRAEQSVAAAEQKAAEQRAAEQRAAEQRAAEQRAAEQRAAEQRAAEQRAAEQRAAEQRAAEQRAAAAEQRAAAADAWAEKRAAEQRAAEQRAAASDAWAEKRAAEQRAAAAEAAIRAAESKAAQDLTNFLIIVIVIASISLVIILAKRKNKKSTTSQRSTTRPTPPPSTSGNTESSTMFFYECPKCHSGDIQNNPDGSVNCPDCGYRG